MKSYKFNGIMMTICLLTHLCEGTTPRERAEMYGAQAEMVVHVIDDKGQAISNVNVEVYFGMSTKEGKTIKGKSDGEGNFRAKGKTTGEVYVNATKTGFYESTEKIELFADEKREVLHGRWMPKEICTNVILRSIGNPIKLLTSALSRDYQIAVKGEWTGFDLEKMDWVAPKGIGKTVDFEVLYESDGKRLFDFTGAKLQVRFVRPFDGAYKRVINKVSRLQTDPVADTNAVYLSELNFYMEKALDGKWLSNKLGKDEFLVLRTRSQIDEKGNFIGAHYSMITGDWSFGWSWDSFGCMGFRSFFNPTFNDPNLEVMNIYNTPNFRQIGGRDND